MTTDPTNRLRRYRRTSTEVACVLTPRDLEILRLVESFRLLNSEHLTALIPGSKQVILRRLQILFHAGYLDRLRPHRVENGGSSKMIYAITNRGVQTLQKEGLIQKDGDKVPSRRQEMVRDPYQRRVPPRITAPEFAVAVRRGSN